MKYLIVQEWDNTKGNHAGMKHMCDLLARNFPNKYEVIVKSAPPHMVHRNNRIIKRLLYSFDRAQYLKRLRKLYKKDYQNICRQMFDCLAPGDEVFLLEYHLDEAPQYDLAVYVRKKFPYVKIYALSHLTPTNIKQKRIENNILLWDTVVDKELTLGSSLSAYLLELGINKEKISTGFHYVDLEYYHPQPRAINNKRGITIIALGNMQRDYSLLSRVVSECNMVNWVICGGVRDVSHLFPSTVNVTIKGYMSEDELRYQMSQADLSINVMSDTVGSNVITTSLAMGLGLIVTDVGSIRDYCDDQNAVFCTNTIESLVWAVKELANAPDRVVQMQNSSKERAQSLSIAHVDEWFSSL